MKEDKLFEIADRQQGFFTAKQAISCGFFRSNFFRKVESGEWAKEICGIYRLARYPISAQPDLVVFSLWSRNREDIPQGIWCRETAMEIHGLSDLLPNKLHMSVPKKFRKGTPIPSVLSLHYEEIERSRVEQREGFQVTSLVQTLVDIANDSRIPGDLVIQGIVEAVHQGKISRATLAQEAVLLKMMDEYGI